MLEAGDCDGSALAILLSLNCESAEGAYAQWKFVDDVHSSPKVVVRGRLHEWTVRRCWVRLGEKLPCPAVGSEREDWMRHWQAGSESDPERQKCHVCAD